jgi:hypothetical protein
MIDDALLEKSRKEMFERIEKMDKLTIAVLRSHLLAEQCMNDYLTAHGVKRKWILKKRFRDKVSKCKSLTRREGADALWNVLRSANQLRNTIAHTLEAGNINEKMKQLKEEFFGSLTEQQVAGLKDQSDDYVAESACAVCAGFIASLTAALRAENPVDGSSAANS